MGNMEMACSTLSHDATAAMLVFVNEWLSSCIKTG